MEKQYPICPDCLCNTVVGFTPPKKGIVGTDEGYKTFGTPEYVDWNRAGLYCCNGSTNCKFEIKFFELTTPQDVKRYQIKQKGER